MESKEDKCGSEDKDTGGGGAGLRAEAKDASTPPPRNYSRHVPTEGQFFEVDVRYQNLKMVGSGAYGSTFGGTLAGLRENAMTRTISAGSTPRLASFSTSRSAALLLGAQQRMRHAGWERSSDSTAITRVVVLPVPGGP